jgi:hypothetical protein
MQLAGDIGRPQRIVYFALGMVLLLAAWATRSVISRWQIVVLVLAGAFLLWIARAGRCEPSATLPAKSSQKNDNDEF